MNSYRYEVKSLSSFGYLCDCAHVFVIVCGILYITRLAFHSKDLFNSFIKIEKMKKG